MPYITGETVTGWCEQVENDPKQRREKEEFAKRMKVLQEHAGLSDEQLAMVALAILHEQARLIEAFRDNEDEK